jgi:hypothetical protein
MSFLNVEKYPPSLLYISLTIGFALIALGLFSRTKSRLARVLIVYGRVPMFFYIVHFYILSVLNVVLFLSRGHPIADGLTPIPNFPFKFVVFGEGYSLWFCYLIWLILVIAMYPICKWYDNYRTEHPEKRWLSYF